MPDPRIVIAGLIDEYLLGTADTEGDQAFFETKSLEFYASTVSEARDLLRRYGIVTWDQERDEYCARIGFLRAVHALALRKMNKPCSIEWLIASA